MNERITHYLTTTQTLSPFVVEQIDDNESIITLASEPTEEQVARIRELILYRDEIHIFPPLSEMVIVRGNVIIIKVPHYEVFCNIYLQLKEFGVKVTDARFDSPDHFEFIYLLKGRNVLNYDELEVLQNLIDPSIKQHDSIRVMGNYGEYTMGIRF